MRSQWGRAAEDAVKECLRGEGWLVVSDGPPLLLEMEGISRWGQIAFKDSPREFRATGELRHGIDLDNFNECLRVEYQSCIPGDLFLVQWRPRERVEPDPLLLMQSFRVLRNVPVQEIPAAVQAWAPRGMIMWRAASFDTVGPIDMAAPGRFTAKEQLRLWRDNEVRKAYEEGFDAQKAGRRWA
jgi:hypothetical protein